MARFTAGWPAGQLNSVHGLAFFLRAVKTGRRRAAVLTEGARCGQTTAQRLQVNGKPGAADLQGELGVAEWRA